MVAKLSSLFRGLYFIRFSIALWLFPLILVGVDLTGAATLTRAILTPERGRQAMSAGFMLFSLGTIVVLTIRLVALNGAERFCDLDVNDWLPRRWGKQHVPWSLFVFAHSAGAVLLVRVAWNMWREGTSDHAVFLRYLLMLVVGVVFAWAFCLLIAAFYWWSFDSEQANGRPPRAVLLPRRLVPLYSSAIRNIQLSPPPPLVGWLNSLFGPVSPAVGNRRGYSDGTTMLYEGHRLALIAFLGLILFNQYDNAKAAVVQFNNFLADHPPANEVASVAKLAAGAYKQAGVPVPSQFTVAAG